MVAYRNGVALTRGLDPTSFGTTLPATYSLYLGAMNVTGSLVGVRACTLGWVDIGALLTADQELAQYNAVQTFMTAVGANV